MNTTVRKIVVSGMLSGIAIFLGATNLGMIPVPTPAGHATIMHLPVILGAILEGPVVATFIGLIFGIYSFVNATTPFFADPLVAILPRLLIGPLAYLSYRTFSSKKIAVPLAAAVGTVTNTVLVLGMVAIRGYLPAKAVVAVGFVHGIPEVIVAVLIVSAVVPAIVKATKRDLKV
jgi:uncharacterized membrane protein